MKRLIAAMISAALFAGAASAQTIQPAYTVSVTPAAVQMPAKRSGTVRIGLVQPKLDLGPATANSAEALRSLLGQYLVGPNIEVVPLSAMLPIQAEAEAKQKDCDYILYASLSQKKSGGLGFLKSAQSMTGMVPVIGMAGRTSAIVGQAAAHAALSTAGQLAAGVKAKNEVTFEYRLVAPGSPSPLLADIEKSKAQSDGQDVITPMVEQAATAIVGTLAKK
jgi:hypothetical protein